MIPELECGVCHLKWLPRTTTGKPVRCPRCGKPYKGPILVGILLPCEADQFFEKIGFDYQHIFKDALIAYLETWQLDAIEKGNVDEALFQESVKIFQILGCPERSIKREALEG